MINSNIIHKYNINKISLKQSRVFKVYLTVLLLFKSYSMNALHIPNPSPIPYIIFKAFILFHLLITRG